MGIFSWLGSTRAEAKGTLFVIETMTGTPAEKLVHAVDCSFVDEVGWPFSWPLEKPGFWTWYTNDSYERPRKLICTEYWGDPSIPGGPR